MTSPENESADTTELRPIRPPLLGRILVGGVIFVGLLLLFVVLPYEALTMLGASGVSSTLPLATATTIGLLLAALSTVRFVVKPTSAYGPAGVVQSVAALLYLYLLAPFASVSALIMNAEVTVTYGDLLLIAMIIPLLSLIAAALTTLEDLRHPFERVRYDFPAPGAGWR